MEILLSDDCSTDETFAIMQEMANTYSGPHEVVVRRNEANLGFIDHINTVFQIARGEWVVVAAGDDISLPNRVAEIVRVISEYPDINMVSSALIAMDEQGNKRNESCVFCGEKPAESENVVVTGLAELIGNRAPYVHGATLAYSKKLTNYFPSMPSDAIYEDAIYRFRSALLGTKAHINQPLVCYRNHPDQTTNTHAQYIKKHTKRKTLAVGGLSTVCQLLDDLRSASPFDEVNYHSAEKFLTDEFEYRKVRCRLMVWLWPFRALYLFPALMHSRKRNQSLKRATLYLLVFLLKFCRYCLVLLELGLNKSRVIECAKTRNRTGLSLFCHAAISIRTLGQSPLGRGLNNFGDCLQPDILKHYGFTPVYVPQRKSDVVLAGSILQWIPSDYKGIIIGTGGDAKITTSPTLTSLVLGVN